MNPTLSLTLSLSSELSTFTISQGNTRFTSRVAIITYADTANQVAHLTTYANITQIQQALFSINVSSSSSVAGLVNAADYAVRMISDAYGENDQRISVPVLFSSSLNGLNTNIADFVDNIQYLTGQNLITINYNQSDATLTSDLNQWAADSFNFTNDAKVYQNLKWALLQANCYCESAQLTFRDPKTGRLERYADCGLMTEWLDIDQNMTVLSLCEGDAPFAITSQAKFDFIQYHDYLDVDSFYIGLHRNAQKHWVWWDYSLKEFPLGNFTAWASGFNSSSTGDCVYGESATGDNTSPYLWKTGSCYPYLSDIAITVCQHRACDADYDWESNKHGCGLPEKRNEKIKKVVKHGKNKQANI
uniref:C-type lectin n=1 Tax=Acrobeloides nanus TaxID=290746 RepID=A0A914C2Q5_9BILA